MENDDIMDMMNNLKNLNPMDYPSVKCSSCGYEYFESKMMYKEIPGVVVGSKEPKEYYPVRVIVCAKCGEICPPMKKEMEELKNKKTASNLII